MKLKFNYSIIIKYSQINSGKQTRDSGKGGGQGVGVTGDGHWGGHLTGRALGVILYVGKLNSNKKI